MSKWWFWHTAYRGLHHLSHWALPCWAQLSSKQKVVHLSALGEQAVGAEMCPQWAAIAETLPTAWRTAAKGC